MLIHHVQGWEFPDQNTMANAQYLPNTRYQRGKLGVAAEVANCTLLSNGYMDIADTSTGTWSMYLYAAYRDIVPFASNRRTFMGFKIKMAWGAGKASITSVLTMATGAALTAGFTAFLLSDFPNFADGVEYYCELDMDFPNNVIRRRINGVDLATVTPTAAMVTVLGKVHTYGLAATQFWAQWGMASALAAANYPSGGAHTYLKDIIIYEYETGETPAYLGEVAPIPLNVASVDSTQWTASSGAVIDAFNTGFTVADTASTPLVTTDTAMTPSQIKMSLSAAPVGKLVGLQLTAMAKYNGTVRGDLGGIVTTNGVAGVKRDYPLQSATTGELPIHSSAKAPDGSVWTKALIEASSITVTI